MRYELRGTDWQGGSTWITRSDSWQEIADAYADELACEGWRYLDVWDRVEGCPAADPEADG